jgi:hypothetical protein
MQLVDRAGLTADRLASLSDAVPRQETLADAVAWWTGHSQPLRVAEVVVQDEYTHDVVVPWRAGLVLVYDTT